MLNHYFRNNIFKNYKQILDNQITILKFLLEKCISYGNVSG